MVGCRDSLRLPCFAGTQISDAVLDLETAGFHTVKGFATIDHVALINVEVSWRLCAEMLNAVLLPFLVDGA